MWTRGQLKERAKADVARSYWGLVLMSLIIAIIDGLGRGGSSGGSSDTNGIRRGNYTTNDIDWDLLFVVLFILLIAVLAGILVGLALNAFLLNPLRLGATRYYIEAARGEKRAGDIGLIGYAFGSGHYKNIVKTLFLRDLYVLLWSLLLVIPGIVKSYEYAMIPYILAERPDLESQEVFNLSRRMMDGEKFDTFVLGLSFIGWLLLVLISFGLAAVFYVDPYMNMTNAELYEVLRGKIGWSNPNYGNYGMGYQSGAGNGVQLTGGINYPRQYLDM